MHDVIDAQSVNAQLEPLDVEFIDLGPVQARIEAIELIQGNKMLNINCSSQIIGDKLTEELIYAIDIPATSQMRQWHFCTSDDYSNAMKTRGFNLTVEDLSGNSTNGSQSTQTTTYQVLCDNAIWSRYEPMDFATGDYVTKLIIYWNNRMKGNEVTTNLRQFTVSGQTTNAEGNTVEVGQKLLHIEWSERVDKQVIIGIRFQFKECD